MYVSINLLSDQLINFKISFAITSSAFVIASFAIFSFNSFCFFHLLIMRLLLLSIFLLLHYLLSSTPHFYSPSFLHFLFDDLPQKMGKGTNTTGFFATHNSAIDIAPDLDITTSPAENPNSI